MIAWRYYDFMIRTFRCRDTERLFHRERPRRFPTDVHRRAYGKLVMLHAATTLEDLRSPPGNRLEALRGSRRGRHSIRVNDQWRVCFVWRDGGADDVEMVDYH